MTGMTEELTGDRTLEMLRENKSLHGDWVVLEGKKTNYWVFEGLDLSLAVLTNCSFHGGYFAGADLSNARVSNCRFERSSLNNANLKFATFRDCSFDGATFASARMTQARFTNCTFRRCFFAGAAMRRVMFEDCCLAEVADLQHASVSWSGHGEQGRQLTAIITPQDETVYHCGCFHGSRKELLEFIHKEEEDEHHLSREWVKSRLQTLEIVDMLLHRVTP